jgi:hypothetical protein
VYRKKPLLISHSLRPILLSTPFDVVRCCCGPHVLVGEVNIPFLFLPLLLACPRPCLLPCTFAPPRRRQRRSSVPLTLPLLHPVGGRGSLHGLLPAPPPPLMWSMALPPQVPAWRAASRSGVPLARSSLPLPYFCGRSRRCWPIDAH